MLEQLLREVQLVDAVEVREVGRGARAQPGLVVVADAGDDLLAFAARRVLAGDIGEVRVAERAVVEPVVAAPAVDHGAHRHGGLQRRVRVDEGHQHGKTFVRRADHADLAVRLRDVLDQPVDGVVRVGRVVDRRVVQRAAHGARHHVVAFGAVFAAHVLEHADVAILDEGIVAFAQHRIDVRALVALRALGRVVGRAGQHDGRVGHALRNHDHGVQLDAIAHRDHLHALDVVRIRVGRRGELGRNIGRHRRGLRVDGAGDEDGEDGEAGAKAHAGVSRCEGRVRCMVLARPARRNGSVCCAAVLMGRRMYMQLACSGAHRNAKLCGS